jgi:DNA-binding PadR family transcriptional regulator
MSISFAILAFLSAGPRSGYDLKKLFAESESLHWSGNNNQVYAALIDLHRTGLATVEVQQPPEGPARKLYSITDAGTAALREWLATPPELPPLRLPIAAQLAAADLLSPDDLDALLGRYAEELRARVWTLEELERRERLGPSYGSPREQLIWAAINARPAAFYRAEEEWVRNLRWALANHESGQR